MLTRRIALILFLITSLVLVALVSWLTLTVRAQLRRVFIDQHGEILQPLAASQLRETRETLLLTGDLVEASDLLGLVLADVDVDAVVDVRLFDTDGFLISEDLDTALSVAIHPDDRRRALDGLPSTRYHPEATLQALFPEDGRADRELGMPLVEVAVPLRDAANVHTIAIARYLLNGEETELDLAEMDGQLLTMSVTLLLVALLVLGGLYRWAFSQLERSRLAIEAANRRLVELNHQLAFADRSSAIGTLTAHLIHGLKNPLAALRGLFEEPEIHENRVHGKERVGEMEQLIDQLVSVIRDEESELVYEYQLGEIRELLVEKTRVGAARADVALEIGSAPELTLTGRQGNVIVLILVNLIDNALDASKPGASVRVSFGASGREGVLRIEVRDAGDGICAELQERLFVPKRSGTGRGTGIGLVISAQLARQIGGELLLVETGAGGTCFALEVALTGTAPPSGDGDSDNDSV